MLAYTGRGFQISKSFFFFFQSTSCGLSSMGYIPKILNLILLFKTRVFDETSKYVSIHKKSLYYGNHNEWICLGPKVSSLVLISFATIFHFFGCYKRCIFFLSTFLAPEYCLRFGPGRFGIVTGFLRIFTLLFFYF